MSGHHVGVEVASHGLGKYYRVEEYGGLCDFGLLEVFVGAFKHYVSDAEAEYFVGFLKHFVRCGIVVVEVFAHADKLGTLARKNKCFHKITFMFVSDWSLYVCKITIKN